MTMNIDKLMYYLLLLFALATNVSTGVTSAIIVIGILLTMIKFCIKKEKIYIDKGLIIAILVFTVLEVIVALFSIDPVRSLKETFSTFYRFSPLFFVLIYIREQKKIIGIFIAFILSVIINDAYGAYQFLVQGNLRPAAFNNTATFFASHLLMAIPSLYILGKKPFMPFWVKNMALFTTVFSVIMLFGSGTRGGWIALGIVGVSFFILSKNKKKEIIIGVAVIVAFMSILIGSSSWFQMRVASIFDTKHQSNSERILMWKAGWAIFTDNIVTGIGQNSFQKVYNTEYISPLAKEKVGHTHPHNNLLKVLSEGGIIGLVGFIYLHGYILFLFIQLYREEKVDSYALAGILMMIGIQTEGLTDWNIGQVPIMREYWFLIGLFLSGYYLERKIPTRRKLN